MTSARYTLIGCSVATIFERARCSMLILDFRCNCGKIHGKFVSVGCNRLAPPSGGACRCAQRIAGSFTSSSRRSPTPLAKGARLQFRGWLEDLLLSCRYWGLLRQRQQFQWRTSRFKCWAFWLGGERFRCRRRRLRYPFGRRATRRRHYNCKCRSAWRRGGTSTASNDLRRGGCLSNHVLRNRGPWYLSAIRRCISFVFLGSQESW